MIEIFYCLVLMVNVNTTYDISECMTSPPTVQTARGWCMYAGAVAEVHKAKLIVCRPKQPGDRDGTRYAT